MAADPIISALQTAINRFSLAVPAVSIDGVLGPKTADSLIKALGFIANHIAAARETAAGLISRLVTDQGAYNLAQIAQSAPGLTIYLNDRADESQLPKPGAIVPSNKPIVQTTKATAAPDLVLQLQKQSYAASLAEMFAKMPRSVTYGGGALLAVGALALVIATSRKRKQAAVGAGWY